MNRRSLLAAGMTLPFLAACAMPIQNGLTPVLESDTPIQGVTTSRDGRVFVVFARLDGAEGPRVAEWVNGQYRPYPDAAWNAWRPGAAPNNAFVRAVEAQDAAGAIELGRGIDHGQSCRDDGG